MHRTEEPSSGQGPSLLEPALEYHRRGWSVISIRTGTKKPACRSWKRYQSEQPTEATLRRWFASGKDHGLAVILGEVSGSLVCRDFDVMEAYEQWVAVLRQQVGYWKGMFEQAKRKNEKLQKEVDALRAENRQLKDRLFAAKSEKKPPKDRSNGLDDPKAGKQPRRPRGHQSDAPGPQRRDYSHLPVVEEEPVELPPDETGRPKCGRPAAEMSETEDSELIEVEVRAHRRRIRRKRYRRTCDCPNVSQTLTAPAPPKLIPKGRYGISVWVHLLLAKFASHRALGNAIEALSHYDLDLPQGTITDGLKHI